MSHAVRVRFAPSPTGHLHIGGARTAIYNWAFARRHGGTFVLRIDDTDPERSTEENTQAILRSLRWLGLDWDEGPEVGGDHGPYFQTQRFDRYSAALERLKAGGAVYPCFCTADELAAKRDAARESGGQAGYDRTCRSLDPSTAEARIAAGEPHVWRIAVPEDRGDITFVDAIRGPMSFPCTSMDDFVLVRSDGTPTYNFATVIDDAEMGITHVIRGDDHLSNTPRQMLVFEAMDAAVPTFAHLSMIWGPDGKRLSKRHGATSVEAYKEAGYMPEAVLNYLALLGWSLDGETTVVTRQMLAENFSLDRISSNPAIFDESKLEWLNGVYIRDLTASEFVDRVVPWLEDAGLTNADDVASRRGWFEELAPLVSERMRLLADAPGLLRFLFVDPVTMTQDAKEKVLAKEGAARSLEAAAHELTLLDEFTPAAVEEALRGLPEPLNLKPKVVFQAVRVAVTGSTVSPPLFESIALLGKARTLARLHDAHIWATP